MRMKLISITTSKWVPSGNDMVNKDALLLRLTFNNRSMRSVSATYCCQAQYLALYRFDVLIHPEEVRWVVLSLELHESMVGRTVSEGNTISLLLSEDVDVCTAAGKWL